MLLNFGCSQYFGKKNCSFLLCYIVAADTTRESTAVNDKPLEGDEKKSNMLQVNSNNDEKNEKKLVNKSKYPRNERVRVSVHRFFSLKY